LNFRGKRKEVNGDGVAVIDHEYYQANQKRRNDDSFDETPN
jgi:hypothetical protein